MTAVSFPLAYRALGNEELAASVVVVHRSVASLAGEQLLVRVTHASLNFMDPMLQRRNLFQLPMPAVLGFDFAGEVAAAGSDGDGELQLAVGTQVMGSAARGGAFAEYVVVPRHHVVLRRSLPSAEGSTYGVAFSTAYEGLEMEMKVAEHRGKTILIPGAAGGCGHFAVQLARRAGLRVIGTTSKPAGAALLRQLGVELVIDYARQDVAKEVLAFTQGRGADLVWDSTPAVRQSAALVAAGGLWCMLGSARQRQLGGLSQADYDALLRTAQERGATATFSDFARWTTPGPAGEPRPGIRAEILNAGIRYWEEGTVKPRINVELPFEAAALQQAFDDCRAGKCSVGKLVVRVAS